MKNVRQNPPALDESTRTLKAFADPVRLRLLNLLSGERDEVCVCHLFDALGIPQEDEYIRRYCDRTGLADPQQLKTDWNFYMAYNMFRIAAILQGIAKRVEAGTASSAQAVSSAAGARPLAQMAWSFAQKA